MNITVRNIPEEVVEKIRTLSKLQRRSLNSEILILLERSVHRELDKISTNTPSISKETQINIWKKLLNKWEDERTTKEIIDDIYETRTPGREIVL